jgi:hypothetical protein
VEEQVFVVTLEASGEVTPAQPTADDAAEPETEPEPEIEEVEQ